MAQNRQPVLTNKEDLLRGLTITLVYRYETQVMVVTVVALIVLVQVVQMAGEYLAVRADKRDRHLRRYFAWLT